MGLSELLESWGHGVRNAAEDEGAWGLQRMLRALSPMGPLPVPTGASGACWGRFFPHFLLPYKAQDKGDIRLAAQGQGGGWVGGRAATDTGRHHEPPPCRQDPARAPAWSCLG